MMTMKYELYRNGNGVEWMLGEDSYGKVRCISLGVKECYKEMFNSWEEAFRRLCINESNKVTG